MTYTDTQLVQLAQDSPKELARALISPSANVQMLTVGAEILGSEVKDEAIVLPVLRILLGHMNAQVREGACIGVSSFYMDKTPPVDIVDRLRLMSNSDPSLIIRDYSKTLLQDYQIL